LGAHWNRERDGIDPKGYWNRGQQQGGENLAFGYQNFPGGYPGYPVQAPQRRMDDEYPVEWLFNPLDYGVENQLPVERWRRKNPRWDQEFNQLANKCCERGCLFPDDYIELDRRINLCHLR